MKRWITENNVWLAIVIAGLTIVVPIAWDLLKPTVQAPQVVTNNSNITATTGNGAVVAGVINGPVTIGYTQEEYEKGLLERVAELRREYVISLDRIDSKTNQQIEERIAVERELAVLEDKLANTKTSYTEAMASLVIS